MNEFGATNLHLSPAPRKSRGLDDRANGTVRRQANMKRVIFYIDGFNLYHGLKSKSWRRYYWLDVARLASGLLQPDQTLVAARYFTSKIISTGPDGAGKKKRQDAYLEALATLPKVQIHYGHFLEKERRCHACDATWLTYEEKMTDVNIAVKILGDAGG